MVKFTVASQSKEEGADSSIMHRESHVTQRTAARTEPNTSLIH